MKFKINPFTSRMDMVNGFDTVFISNNSYLIKNGNAVELWVNNTLSASWEEDAPVVVEGTPIGLLLALTVEI